MRSELVFVALCVAGSAVGVRYIDANAPAKNAAPVAQTTPGNAFSAYQPGWRREVRIIADRDRHFRVAADVNNRRTEFLIDTGATFVALRETDAQRANILRGGAEFDEPVRTANGEARAARVLVETIEIQGLRLENVDAYILPDDRLSVNLLGMSFLSRLPSVEARGDELILRG
ncbi:MAG: TIGR02281 family clan AA aspartic protease [Pseudomonadota bacterium]